MIDICTLNEQGLEDILSEPTEATKKVLANLAGDIVVLGAGGKMGPTLAMMLKKACPPDKPLGRRASSKKNIYAVSRFTDKAVKTKIEQALAPASGRGTPADRRGLTKTIEIDLLDESAYSQLPNVENVFYMVGMKFGVTGKEPLTWALNSFFAGPAGATL